LRLHVRVLVCLRVRLLPSLHPSNHLTNFAYSSTIDTTHKGPMADQSGSTKRTRDDPTFHWMAED